MRKPNSLIVLLFIQFLTSFPRRHSFKFWPISRHGFRYKQMFFLRILLKNVDNIDRAICFQYSCISSVGDEVDQWSVAYCSLFPIKYNIDQPRFNQYTIDCNGILLASSKFGEHQLIRGLQANQKRRNILNHN